MSKIKVLCVLSVVHIFNIQSNFSYQQLGNLFEEKNNLFRNFKQLQRQAKDQKTIVKAHQLSIENEVEINENIKIFQKHTKHTVCYPTILTIKEVKENLMPDEMVKSIMTGLNEIKKNKLKKELTTLSTLEEKISVTKHKLKKFDKKYFEALHSYFEDVHSLNIF